MEGGRRSPLSMNVIQKSEFGYCSSRKEKTCVETPRRMLPVQEKIVKLRLNLNYCGASSTKSQSEP